MGQVVEAVQQGATSTVDEAKSVLRIDYFPHDTAENLVASLQPPPSRTNETSPIAHCSPWSPA